MFSTSARSIRTKPALSHGVSLAVGRLPYTRLVFDRTSGSALTVRGKHIAWLNELAPYTYAVPEHLNPPDVVTNFVTGRDVAPDELYNALDREARGPVSDDPDALRVIDLLLERLRVAFPSELTS